MDAERLVHDLRDVQVDADARQHAGVAPGDSELPRHQREHALDRDRSGAAEVRVEAERQPGAVDARDRPFEQQVVPNIKGQARPRGGLDRRSGDLTVALRGVPVAGGEQRALDRYRKVERRSGDELLAVDVPAPAPRRNGRVDTRLRRRHSQHAEERCEVELPSERSPDSLGEGPVDCVTLTAFGESPVSGLDFVDANGERLAGPRPAHRDRTGQRMSGVQLGRLRDEPLLTGYVPSRIRHGDSNRIARLDLEHGLEVGGEVAVEHTLLERQLVDGHSYSSSFSTASTTRSTEGMYASSICQ